MMTILTRASDRQTVSLSKQIADSGEGEVWETNFSGILAKIYHNPTPERIEKLKAMLANPPVDPMKSKNHISIAFPQDLLQDGSGNCVGFLMPAVPSSRELTSIYNPRLRKRNAPGFNWYYLHVTALNTAWIIQAIHEKGYVLGDIKPQNILVNDRALVAVIDTDSFQVRNSQTGKVYRCTVGSDGFTPVELLGKDFAVTDQSEICDRFRLAVLIHYLLFGYHPFSGEWTGAGESPDQTELIRKGLWYAGNNSLIRPSQSTIPLDVVHPEIKRLFLKCFNDGHASPKLRPTAEDWHNALQVAVNDLTICGKVDSHHYSRSYGKCYWCERSVKLSIDIFPSVSGNSTTVINTTTPITRLTKQRQATTTPSTNPNVPSVTPSQPKVSLNYPQQVSQKSYTSPQPPITSANISKPKSNGFFRLTIQYISNKRGFLLQWVLANTVGWALSFWWIYISFSGILFVGIIIGFLQWIVLRRQVSISGWRWILATSLGWFLGLVVAETLTSSVVLWAVMGATVGVMQWIVLRQQVARFRWWVLANSLGWVLGGTFIQTLVAVPVSTLTTGILLVWLL